MSEQPIAGVLVTRRYPGYKDVPGVRYHYPKAAYQRTLERLVGALVLFYEPRRGGSSPTALGGGRSAFTGFAFISALRDDPEDPSHGYAELRYAMDFNTVVAISSTNIAGKALQTAVLPVPYEEACRILTVGLSLEQPAPSTFEREGLSDIESLVDIERRPIEEVVRNERVRDASFRYQVVEKVYNGTCAFTGIRLTNGRGRAEVDAAHIRSVAENGPDTVRNGIALMKTMHWAFDRGLVSLADDGRILTVERGLDAAVMGLLRKDGRAVLPTALDNQPHPTFLRWHRETLFKGVA